MTPRLGRSGRARAQPGAHVGGQLAGVAVVAGDDEVGRAGSRSASAATRAGRRLSETKRGRRARAGGRRQDALRGAERSGRSDMKARRTTGRDARRERHPV